MADSMWSQGLSNVGGYSARPASTTYSPAFPDVPAPPSVPSIAGPNAATRDWLLQQLGPLSQQNQASLTNIQAGAKLQLAGYGGYSFGVDNPATAVREDLQLAFDPNKGPGEKEKGALRAEDAAANSRGLLYSTFANQGKANAMQRLSLEAQAIANQYAFYLNQQHTAYAGQVANISTQWVSLYGQDNQWLAENPPAPPPPPPAAPLTGMAGGQTIQNIAGAGPNGGGGPGQIPAGYSQVWIGQNQPSRAKIAQLNAQYGHNWQPIQLQGGRIMVIARTG